MSMDALRILMISKALVVGSYHRKIEAMVELGMQMHIVLPKKWGDQEAEICKSERYAIHILPIIFSGKNHYHFYRHLEQLIDSVHPHLIHIDEESYSLITFQAMRIAKSRNIPTLFFNWQNIFKKYPWPFSSVEYYTITNASAGIAGTNEAKDVLLRKGCRIPLYVIPQFGVDTKDFTKQPQLELRKQIVGSSEAFVVGFAGRFVKEKGISDLVTACSQLSSITHIVLIGEGPVKDRLLRQASLLGMKERCHILNYIKSKEMPRYLNILDCLVLPSRTRPNWKEQFGRILIEAMACEVPVIGSSSGEIPNVIGRAGIIFPEGDSVALREILRDLMSNNTKRIQLGIAGHCRVQECFTHHKVAKDTIHVYRTIMK